MLHLLAALVATVVFFGCTFAPSYFIGFMSEKLRRKFKSRILISLLTLLFVVSIPAGFGHNIQNRRPVLSIPACS